ncbi:MAG: hypothetical protein ACREID_00605, partial [Planctomycetota bacterium]
MRRALLLLLAATAAAGIEGKGYLLREIKAYDPTELPKGPAIDRRLEEFREKASARARKEHARDPDWRHFIPDHFERNVLLLKRELLAARAKEHAEALAACGAGDDLATAQALCELFVALERRMAKIADGRAEMTARALSLYSGDPMRPDRSIPSANRPEVMQVRTDEQILRDLSDHFLSLRVDVARRLREQRSPEAARFLLDGGLRRSPEPRLRAKIAEILSEREETTADAFVAALDSETDPGVRAALASCLGRLG